MKQKDITIKKIPSLTTAKNYIGWKPEQLEDKKLIRLYAMLSVIIHTSIKGTLPASYYSIGVMGGSHGRIPNDPWFVHSAQYSRDEYWREIQKRGLQDSFTVWDETQHQEAI